MSLWVIIPFAVFVIIIAILRVTSQTYDPNNPNVRRRINLDLRRIDLSGRPARMLFVAIGFFVFIYLIVPLFLPGEMAGAWYDYVNIWWAAFTLIAIELYLFLIPWNRLDTRNRRIWIGVGVLLTLIFVIRSLVFSDFTGGETPSGEGGAGDGDTGPGWMELVFGPWLESVGLSPLLLSVLGVGLLLLAMTMAWKRFGWFAGVPTAPTAFVVFMLLGWILFWQWVIPIAIGRELILQGFVTDAALIDQISYRYYSLTRPLGPLFILSTVLWGWLAFRRAKSFKIMDSHGNVRHAGEATLRDSGSGDKAMATRGNVRESGGFLSALLLAMVIFLIGVVAVVVTANYFPETFEGLRQNPALIPVINASWVALAIVSILTLLFGGKANRLKAIPVFVFAAILFWTHGVLRSGLPETFAQEREPPPTYQPPQHQRVGDQGISL